MRHRNQDAIYATIDPETALRLLKAIDTFSNGTTEGCCQVVLAPANGHCELGLWLSGEATAHSITLKDDGTWVMNTAVIV